MIDVSTDPLTMSSIVAVKKFKPVVRVCQNITADEPGVPRPLLYGLFVVGEGAIVKRVVFIPTTDVAAEIVKLNY